MSVLDRASLHRVATHDSDDVFVGSELIKGDGDAVIVQALGKRLDRAHWRSTGVMGSIIDALVDAPGEPDSIEIRVEVVGGIEPLRRGVIREVTKLILQIPNQLIDLIGPRCTHDRGPYRALAGSVEQYDLSIDPLALNDFDRPARAPRAGIAAQLLMAAMVGLREGLGWERPPDETVMLAPDLTTGDLPLGFGPLPPLD